MKHALTAILLTGVIISSFLYIGYQPVKADGATSIFWLTSDWHGDAYTMGGGFITSYSDAYDAVNDTNAMDVDYCIMNGDWGSYGSTFDLDLQVRLFGNIWGNLSVSNYKNWTIGNHDTGADTIENERADTGAHRSQLYYYHDIGSNPGGIRLICMADEDTCGGGGTPWGGNGIISEAQYNFVSDCITDAYANDSNVFIFCHQKFSAAIYTPDDSGVQTPYPITPLLDYWEDQGKPISLFACGHAHQDFASPSGGLFIQELYGCTCVVASSIARWGTPTHYPCSRYIYLENGSTTVSIRSYNHYNNAFYEPNDYEFYLLYAWNDGNDYPEEGEPPQFVQIDGKTNHSSITNPTPMINWTSVPGAKIYHLEISTTSDFNSLHANITGINRYMPGGYCSMDETHVSFQLPAAYALTGDGTTYYFRVNCM